MSATVDQAPHPSMWRNLYIGLVKTLITLVILLPALYFARENFTLGFEMQKGAHSVPHTVFLIHKQSYPFRADQYIAFETKGLVDPFVDGLTMIKIVAGVPGDTVRVTPEAVFVNQAKVADITVDTIGEKTGNPVSVKTIDTRIPPGHYFVLGTHPKSYDSRFWGLVKPDQLIGRAYGLWK
ncbi:MAG: signal peptidase I [Salinisphaeraceae bacterium]